MHLDFAVVVRVLVVLKLICEHTQDIYIYIYIYIYISEFGGRECARIPNWEIISFRLCARRAVSYPMSFQDQQFRAGTFIFYVRPPMSSFCFAEVVFVVSFWFSGLACIFIFWDMILHPWSSLGEFPKNVLKDSSWRKCLNKFFKIVLKERS